MDRSRLILLAHGVAAFGLAGVGALLVVGGAVVSGTVNFALAAVVLGVGYYVASKNDSWGAN